jgi:hypothetical protein
LTGELEGIKLEMVIMRRDIESNSQTANITLQGKVKRLEQELDSERQKRRQFEADLSILVRGRNAEISELNDIIESLQNKLEASEALNQQPALGINYPNVQRSDGPKEYLCNESKEYLPLKQNSTNHFSKENKSELPAIKPIATLTKHNCRITYANKKYLPCK